MFEFNEPAEKAVGKAEMQMAKQLIESMTQEWKPEQYNDEYHEALEKLIEEKIEDPDKAAPAPTKKRQATNVIDLVSVLQESLQQSKSKVASKKKPAPARRPRRPRGKRPRSGSMFASARMANADKTV